MARRWLAIRRVTELRDAARARQEQDKRAGAVVQVCAMHAKHALILNAVYSDDFAAAYTAMGDEGDDFGQRGGSLRDRAARVTRVNTQTPRGEGATPRRPARDGGQDDAIDTPASTATQGDGEAKGGGEGGGEGGGKGTDAGGGAEGTGEGTGDGDGDGDGADAGGDDTPRAGDESVSTPRTGKKKKGKKKGRRGRSKSPIKRGSSRFGSRSRSKSRRNQLAAEAEAAAKAEEEAKKKRKRRREASKDVLPVVAEDTTSKEWVYPDYAMFEPERSPNPHWVRGPVPATPS